jgi:hypothetical protein
MQCLLIVRLCACAAGVLLQLVPERDFTPEQLAQHDGSNPSLPMLISIRGVVFDVSTGKQFYGPNGEEAAACVLGPCLGSMTAWLYVPAGQGGPLSVH